MTDSNSGGMTAIVAIVAIVIIIGLGFVAYQQYMGNQQQPGTINVELPTGEAPQQ